MPALAGGQAGPGGARQGWAGRGGRHQPPRLEVMARLGRTARRAGSERTWSARGGLSRSAAAAPQRRPPLHHRARVARGHVGSESRMGSAMALACVDSLTPARNRRHLTLTITLLNLRGPDTPNIPHPLKKKEKKTAKQRPWRIEVSNIGCFCVSEQEGSTECLL